MPDATYHTVNPYRDSLRAHQTTIFAPDARRLSVMLASLPAISLRVLFYVLARVEPDGSVELDRTRIARRIPTHPTYVSRGIGALIRYNLLARRARNRYWVSPDVARFIPLPAGMN